VGSLITMTHPPIHRRWTTATALVAVAVVALSACGEDASGVPSDTTRSTTSAPVTTLADGTTTASTEPTTTGTVTAESTIDPTTTAAPSDPEATTASSTGLSDDELAGLLWMREEEQLAHDVYAVLGDEWGLRIFDNITASEQQHIGLTIDALDAYGIADPAAGNEPGTFTDPDIQALYDRLVADGMTSVEDALAVGALIEELDIVDLRTRSAATDEVTLVDLYAQLELGSRNHLRAFTRQLDKNDVDYEPVYLAPADYEAIVSSDMERGDAGDGEAGMGGMGGMGGGHGHGD